MVFLYDVLAFLVLFLVLIQSLTCSCKVFCIEFLAVPGLQRAKFFVRVLLSTAAAVLDDGDDDDDEEEEEEEEEEEMLGS